MTNTKLKNVNKAGIVAIVAAVGFNIAAAIAGVAAGVAAPGVLPLAVWAFTLGGPAVAVLVHKVLIEYWNR